MMSKRDKRLRRLLPLKWQRSRSLLLMREGQRKRRHQSSRNRWLRKKAAATKEKEIFDAPSAQQADDPNEKSTLLSSMQVPRSSCWVTQPNWQHGGVRGSRLGLKNLWETTRYCRLLRRKEKEQSAKWAYRLTSRGKVCSNPKLQGPGPGLTNMGPDWVEQQMRAAKDGVRHVVLLFDGPAWSTWSHNW